MILCLEPHLITGNLQYSRVLFIYLCQPQLQVDLDLMTWLIFQTETINIHTSTVSSACFLGYNKIDSHKLWLYSPKMLLMLFFNNSLLWLKRKLLHFYQINIYYNIQSFWNINILYILWQMTCCNSCWIQQPIKW